MPRWINKVTFSLFCLTLAVIMSSCYFLNERDKKSSAYFSFDKNEWVRPLDYDERPYDYQFFLISPLQKR